jgi:hypothetical protein
VLTCDSKEGTEYHVIRQPSTFPRPRSNTLWSWGPVTKHWIGLYEPISARYSNGVYHFRLEELTPEQQERINQLRRIDTHAAQQNAKVDLNIDTEDFVSAWSKFRKSTASSPSGRHYGHYKAAAVAAKVPQYIGKGENREENPVWYSDLALVHAIMASLPLQYGFTLPRWQRSINLMLGKASGSRIVDNLRIIHLFEADLNFVLKLIWGKRLMRHAEKKCFLGEDQHGSRAGRRATDAVMERF